MRGSDDRILTTHVGSIPRNAALRDLLVRQDRGEPIDERELEREVEAAVRTVVARQLEAGIDVGNDGEQPRAGFSTYVARRMRGFGGESKRLPSLDVIEFPDYGAMLDSRRRAAARIGNAPQALADIHYDDLGEAARECDVFARATQAAPGQFAERFMTAASPGIIATTMLNAYYDSHEKYVFALAREMKKEYELIVARGFVLQLDAPDLAMERVVLFKDKSLAEFQAIVEMHIAAINEALANIPRDRVRLHCCWGNYDGPHVHDVPVGDILPLLCQARVGGLSLEMANPRHQHEYAELKRRKLPDGMILLPGVLDSTNNYVEHPQVVANRICEAVDAVGDRTRVIASTDCGFGTFAGYELVASDVVWAKLKSAREGADIATRRLWGR